MTKNNLAIDGSIEIKAMMNTDGGSENARSQAISWAHMKATIMYTVVKTRFFMTIFNCS